MSGIGIEEVIICPFCKFASTFRSAYRSNLNEGALDINCPRCGSILRLNIRLSGGTYDTHWEVRVSNAFRMDSIEVV
jgi:phage FluMu protein Com